MKVNVSEQGGIFNSVDVKEGSTVQDALKASDACMNDGKTIFRNNDEASLDETVQENDNIYVVPKAKGN